MPYIPKNKRYKLEWIASNLASELCSEGVTGNLNYVLYKTFVLLHKFGLMNSYKDMSRFIAELECNKLEVYRRMIAPYEDEKIKENGDVE